MSRTAAGAVDGPDALVVGAGPNGLAAAITLAGAGLAVQVLEAQPTPGGAVRSAALTLPGFVHDLGAAVHPLAAGSPLFRRLRLERHGLRWVNPPIAVAHPLDDGSAALLYPSAEETARRLGPDGPAWLALLLHHAVTWNLLAEDLLAPLHWPRHPLLLARFGLQAARAARSLAEGYFAGERARALFAGLAAHAGLPLDLPGSAATALVLGAVGHRVGWPFPAGGAGRLSEALLARLGELGGTVQCGRTVTTLGELPPAATVLLDVTPRQALRLTGDALPWRYRRSLAAYQYGPGVFKVDWALAGPIPWRAEECRLAGTVHLGGTLAEIAASLRAVARGEPAPRPFVLLSQPSLFDPSRAPPGQHVAWAYCHVPNGSAVSMLAALEAQVERFAPGFADRILARHVTGPAQLEQQDANLVGGDIAGGASSMRQLLFRPVPGLTPHATPDPRLFLCSASTPPGPGVHGMCGYHAARLALRRVFGVRPR